MDNYIIINCLLLVNISMSIFYAYLYDKQNKFYRKKINTLNIVIEHLKYKLKILNVDEVI